LRHGVLLVFGAPLPASIAGGAGARPDHSISRHLLNVCAVTLRAAVSLAYWAANPPRLKPMRRFDLRFR
jgi:hypothetical protein